MANPLDGLTEEEQEFVEYLTNDSKLNDAELEAKFGPNLTRLRCNMNLRRVSAEIKMNRSRRKYLIDNYKLDTIVKTIPMALHTLLDVMKNGKEHNRLSAAQTLLRPSLSYLERAGVSVAGIELVNDGEMGSQSIRIVIDKQDEAL